MRRLFLPALFGVVGTLVLVALGVWQLDRAAQKDAVIADMEARLRSDPVPLPAEPDSDTDRYRTVTTAGSYAPAHSFVLSNRKGAGPGFRVISAFVTDGGRRILVDRGFVPEAARADLGPLSGGPVTLVGNLDWPQDADSFTPGYDAGRNLFFSRRVGPLADRLDTARVLVVLRAARPAHPVITPVPVDGVAVPDNHLGYAVQWFLMAVVWAGMTLLFLWRIRAQRD